MVTELRNIDDTFLSQDHPDTNYRGHSRIKLDATDNHVMIGALFLPMPGFVPGMVIQSYKLRLYGSTSLTGTTYEVRRWTSKKSASSMTWRNRPDNTGVVASATTTGGYVDIDLTSLAQQWLTGTPNYGIRLSTTSNTRRHLYSVQGGVSARSPRVIIEWSAPPATPSGFVASGERQFGVANPILPWVYSDPSGSPMKAYQYQQNPTNTWGAPAVDTGTVLSGSPQHQLAAVADGQQFWYRVRHQNAAGLWSPWSQPQQTGRTVKKTLTLLLPDEAPNNVVYDVTPTILWDFDGVQTSWQAFVYASGRQDSLHRVDDDDSWAPPKALNVGVTYTAEVRAWDDVPRVSIPNDPSYAVVTREFTVVSVVGVPPVTALTTQAAPVGPAVVVGWNSAVADSFVVERRDSEDGPWRAFPVALGDAFVEGSTYSWTDVTAPPQHELVYRVHPVLNGQMGEAPAEVTIETFARYIWLLDPEDPTWVLPVAGGDEGEWVMGEQSTFVEVRGADRVHLVHEGFRGYEGSSSGIFASDLPYVGRATARELHARALRLKREPVNVWRLVIGDLNIPVVVRMVNLIPRPAVHELTFGVAFEFAQQGELAWEDED